jgi:hypothetical protein
MVPVLQKLRSRIFSGFFEKTCLPASWLLRHRGIQAKGRAMRRRRRTGSVQPKQAAKWKSERRRHCRSACRRGSSVWTHPRRFVCQTTRSGTGHTRRSLRRPKTRPHVTHSGSVPHSAREPTATTSHPAVFRLGRCFSPPPLKTQTAAAPSFEGSCAPCYGA